MMTNKELSQAIRNELKAHGITSRMVSVRVSDAGYSTAANLTIKTASVNPAEVAAITRKFEAVDYDEYTGEILQGANVYVRVSCDDAIYDEVAKPYEGEAAALLDNLDDRECVQIAEGLWLNKFRDVEIHQEKGARRIVGDAKSLSRYLYKFDTFGTIAA